MPESVRWIILLAFFAVTTALTITLRWGELPATPYYPVVLLSVMIGSEKQGYLLTALSVAASTLLSLALWSPSAQSPETMDSAVLALVGGTLIVAMRQNRSQEHLIKHITYETGIVRALGTYALTRLDRNDLMRAVTRYLANSTDADCALLVMPDAAHHMLVGYADNRALGQGPTYAEREMAHSLAGEVFLSGKSRRLSNAQDAEGFKPWVASPLGSLICVPLTLAGHPIGVLGVGKQTEDAFSEEDVRLVETLARTISVPLYASRHTSTERQTPQAAR